MASGTDFSARQTILDGYGGLCEIGCNSALVTFSSSGTTFNTAATVLPAAAIIAGVTARVETAIAGATAWTLGDASVADRFASATSSQLSAGERIVGLTHIDVAGTSGPRQTSAAALRITTTGTPTAGAVRVSVHYARFTAPTSS